MKDRRGVVRGFYAELYRDSIGEWRWVIFADNGRRVADSGEGYVNRGDCRHEFRRLHPFMRLRERPA